MELSETTEALPSQGIAPTSWFGWGMSGVWSFLGYSSAPSSTHQIPELPSEAQLSELYKALNFQPSSQLEKKEHQRILSFELKVGYKSMLVTDINRINCNIVKTITEFCSLPESGIWRACLWIV